MSNTTKLSNAIKFALFVGAASSAATVTAFAQEATEDAKTLDRVEVTGSRIKRVDAETTQPVAIVTRADIEKSGLTSVYDILNNITSSDGSGLSTTTTQTNGSDGSQQISLRGLGADRTLVLVDGKRWITDIDGTVDLSTIPVAIIERIDILKDGASAIYGSDAIAGVVNIITRKSYEGAQFGVYYGQTSKGDGAQKTADLTIGSTGERTQTVMSISYSEQQEILAGDRKISSEPYYGCFEYYGGYCSYGSSSSQYGRLYTGSGQKTLNPNANLADGLQVGDFNAWSNAARYNYAPINYLQQPAKRLNLFAAGRFDITDNVSAYGRASYTKRYSDQKLAEVPATFATNGANGPQWAFGIDANQAFNPGLGAINQGFFRNSAVGPRNPSYDYDIFSLQAGLEGDFEIGDSYFSWDLSAMRNDGQYDSRGTGYLNLFNLKNALGAGGYDAGSDTFYCGATYATRIRGCMPYNIFGGPTLGLGTNVNLSTIPGGNTAPVGRVITADEVQQMINYVGYTQVSTSGSTTMDYAGNISGDLFELPAGMLSIAAGFEVRTDSVFNQPDTLVSSGGSSDNFQEPTQGSTSVTEFFGEITIPLLKDVFLAQELEIRAAVRTSDYSANGKVGLNQVSVDPGSPTNAMYGLKWKPFTDLMIRGSYGEVFRAPSAFDLFGGGSEGFPSANDPCRSNVLGAAGTAFNVAANAATCTAAGLAGPGGFGTVQDNSQLRSLNGGDPTLKPEYGDTATYGFVYSPSYAEGLDITVDYWQVNLTDVQSTLGVTEIMNRCLGTGGFTADAFFCTKVDRTASGSVATIRTARVNLAELESSGIDFGGSYRWDAGNWGNFRFQIDSSYTIESRTRGSATGAWSDSVGTYNGAPSFEWRTVGNIDWNKGDYSARWTTRYMSDITEDTCFANSLFSAGFSNCKADGLNHTGSYMVHDLNLGWSAPWDAQVGIGVRNLFGKEPPILYNSFAHSFDAAYDLPGGAYWYMSYRQDF